MTSKQLESAWNLRLKLGAFERNQAVRIFHGPGEGAGELKHLLIERFADTAWVTEREAEQSAGASVRAEIGQFLGSRGLKGGVWLPRPKQGVPGEPEVFFGEVAPGEFEIDEEGLKFGIRLLGSKHPGLFLDHLPLRRWLRQNCRGLKVLNTFAYTGSLSVAAGVGGAEHVTTLDLSKPTIRWAESNWARNELEASRARLISGDVFEWLPRLKREKQLYDCVILDPPSFSRGVKGTFSTSKDLEKLHSLAIALVAPGGYLVTSINSATVPLKKMEAEIRKAAENQDARFEEVAQIELPPTFPTRQGDAEARYLKGYILRRVG